MHLTAIAKFSLPRMSNAIGGVKGKYHEDPQAFEDENRIVVRPRSALGSETSSSRNGLVICVFIFFLFFSKCYTENYQHYRPTQGV